MSKKGKAIRRLTFNLDIGIENELYEQLTEFTGAGIDLLIEHYKFYKKYKDKINDEVEDNFDEVEDNFDEEYERKLYSEYEEEEDGFNKVLVDEYEQELQNYLDNPADLLIKAKQLAENGDLILLHLIDGEVLDDIEYKRRTWRPHHELNHNKREEISTKLYGTSNNEIRRKSALDYSRKFNEFGVKRTALEMREYRDKEQKIKLLDTILEVNKD